MKKIISFLIIFLVLCASFLSVNVFAATLNSINITTTKETVFPGQNVTLNIDFGQDLGSYTVDVAYDNNLFDFVSIEGGTENDNGTRVRAYYFDQTGGSSPRRNVSITFKAKDNILTSNPTDFSITASGLANPDASVTYDDITTPIVKNVIVEPEYIDYNIALNYTGDVLVNKEKDMKLTISSKMGKNYEHTRIIAEATSQTGGTVKLLGTDSAGLEHDIIQSGWGDASGDPIGGKDVSESLSLRGMFTRTGDYTITFKLIDRDNSDDIIAQNTFNISVKEETATVPTPGINNPQTPPTTTTPEQTGEQNQIQENNKEKEPTVLPKTGNTVYGVIVPIILVLVILSILLRKKY